MTYTYSKQLHKFPMYSIMEYDFRCGDGWFTLLHTLSQSIVYIINRYDIIDFKVISVDNINGKLLYNYSYNSCNHIYGRIYLQEIIKLAQTLSEYICEACGATGKKRIDINNKILCTKHYFKLKSME